MGGRCMEIVKVGMAGTLESSDASITVEPPGLEAQGLELTIECPDKRFATHVARAVRAALEEAGVVSARVSVRDRSALDCTIRARVLTACQRAAGRVSS
jgi:citrate lyase subunit gamma (acyl carrier protein)